MVNISREIYINCSISSNRIAVLEQEEVVQLLNNIDIRCKADTRNEKISYKVREHSAAKVPVILALGKREKSDRTVSIRRIGSDKTETLNLDDVLKLLKQENINPG